MIAAMLMAALAQGATPAADTLRASVERLSTATANEQRFDAMTAMLRERSIPFTVERFTVDKALGKEPRTEGRNIVATFGSGGEPIVVGAHYDAARIPDGSLSHGAVDNAGSSAILIRLAEVLKTEPPARRVTLVWFDMEELGLIGSAKYAEAHKAERIGAMVNLDVNAYGDTVLFGSSRGAENAVPRKALLETCAATDTMCVGFVQMPPGDERSFVKAGVPSISIAILPAAEAHQLWLLMTGPNSGLAKETMPAVLKTLHTSDDVIDKVDAAAMARQADFILSLVRRLLARP